MRDAKMSGDRLQAPVATRGRVLNITLWVLQVLLAFIFGGAGFLKLSAAPEMVAMFATIGAGQWLRIVVGTLEVAAAVGLLIPRLAGLAALGLCCLLLGAAITSLVIPSASPLTALVLLCISALVAWGRWPQTGALAGLFGR